MRRVCVGLVFGLLFWASTAIAAEIPLEGFQAETVVTAEKLAEIAGIDGEIEAQVLAVDTDGDLIVFCDARGRISGALLEIDVSRSPVTGSVIVPEIGPGSLDEAQRKSTEKERKADINFNNIAVSSDGTIYGGEYQGADEILVIRRGDTTVVESLFEVTGLNGMALGYDSKGNEALFWVEEKAFQGDDSFPVRDAVEGLHIYPLPSGPHSVLIQPEILRLATNNPDGPGLHDLAVAPDGHFAVSYDRLRKGRNFILGGTNQLLRMIPFSPGDGSPEVDVPYSSTFFEEMASFKALAIDENGTIYGWNEPGGDRSLAQLEILKGEKRWTITNCALRQKLGASDITIPSGGIQALAQPDGIVIIYAVNSFEGGIIKIILPPETFGEK